MHGRECLRYKDTWLDLLVAGIFPDGSLNGEARLARHLVSHALVSTSILTEQCPLPRRRFLSLGDNGRTFPSQTSAEGQEDEQWQRSRTFYSRPPKLESTSIPARSFPLASTQLGVAMGDSANDTNGSGLVQMGSWPLGIFRYVYR
jgi:hypothetical protein